MKFLASFLLVVPILLQAQTFVNRTYSQLYDIQAKSTVQMGNGNYLVTGTQAFANGFLSLHSPNGQCVNTVFLSQGALSSFSDLTQVTKINDTLAIVSGKISLAGGPAEVWKGITIAVNDQGVQLWSLIHNVNDPGIDATITDVERLSDTTFLVLCSSIGNASNSMSKVDVLGNIQWTKSYESNETGFKLSDVCVMDSLIFLGGNRFNLGAYSGVILRLDSLGNLEDGWNYSHSVQPDFVQLLATNQGLIVANRGHAMSALDLINVDFSGIVLAQKSFPINMGMPEEEANKPLAPIDSSTCWYWNGGDFGSFAFQINQQTLMPINAISHMGNIQTIIDQDTTLQVLATGPLYGIKNQLILQKHYAITSADSLESLFTFCTYPTNEMPLNELAPVKSNFLPNLGIGNTPSPFFYPLIQNEPWVNETFCVEMLGALEEETLRFGPNPCHEFIEINKFPNQSYQIHQFDGKLISQGNTSQEGRIYTLHIPNGSYLIQIGNQQIIVIVAH